MKLAYKALLLGSLFTLAACGREDDDNSEKVTNVFENVFETDGSTYTCTTQAAYDACIQDDEPTAGCSTESACDCEGECPDLSVKEVSAELCSIDGSLQTGESCSIDDAKYVCTDSGLKVGDSTICSESLTIKSITISCNAL